jgi:DNA polymerase-3 subunit alpha
MGIAVLPPDINESLPNFTYINDNTIRFGLVVIKNLGQEVVETIVAERQANGLFKDLADFCARVHHRAFNKKSLEALIKAGALDGFGERRCLLENLDQILSFNKESKEKQAQNQSSLFDLSPSLATEKLKLRPTPPAEKKDLLSWEKELLGLYISAHPYDEVGLKLGSYLMPLKDLQTKPNNSFVKCGGLITLVKTIVTKKGDNMAFVGIDDKSGKAEVIVFPTVFAQFSKLLVEDNVLLISAKASRRDGEETKLLGNSFIVASDARVPDLVAMLQDNLWVPDDGSRLSTTKVAATSVQKNLLINPAITNGSVRPSRPAALTNRIEITLVGKPDPELIASLRELCSTSPGAKKVRFILDTSGVKRVVETDYSVNATPEFVSELKKIVGERNVVV